MGVGLKRLAVAGRHRARSQSNGMVATAMLVLMLTLAAAHASPIEPGAVEVVDGDTIRLRGRTVRLVGFDTPEKGSRARCESERTLAAAASSRLRQLIAGGGLDFESVACACRPGTEGTHACNHGRACGTLKARGKDVGSTLIGEGLARVYECGRRSCPTRQEWCKAASALIEDLYSPALEEGDAAGSESSEPDDDELSTPKKVKKSARRGDCGSRGGPGYRLPNGKCASGHDR